jgi:hypothetical protein
MRREVVEHEARALAGARIERCDGVGEPARIAHDRRRPVALRVHLVQAAGLVQRGHEEEVHAGLDHVRELLVEALPQHGAARELVPELAQEALVARVAVPERDEARIARREHARQGALEQLDALLVREPRDDAERRRVGRVRKADRLEQRLLVLLLAVEAPVGIARRQVRVGARVPHVLVDAVEDAREHVMRARAAARAGRSRTTRSGSRARRWG